jgi:hypothetical protein
MLERSKIRSSHSGRGGVFPIVLAVASLILMPLIGVGRPAVAAANGSPSANHKDTQELACKTDIKRFCSEANLKQECLVARWNKISPECRNVLGSSTGNHPGGGS